VLSVTRKHSWLTDTSQAVNYLFYCLYDSIIVKCELHNLILLCDVIAAECKMTLVVVLHCVLIHSSVHMTCVCVCGVVTMKQFAYQSSDETLHFLTHTSLAHL